MFGNAGFQPARIVKRSEWPRSAKDVVGAKKSQPVGSDYRTTRGYHSLTGNRKGQYSVSVSGNWRITFRFENGDTYDANLQDYH